MKGTTSSTSYSGILLPLVILLIFASEAANQAYPQQQGYNGRNSYYRYAAKLFLPTHYPLKAALNTARNFGLPRESYQRYIVCEPRTFSYEDCTLCLCTDKRNISLCWDDDERKCAQTQKFVNEQRNSKNNDPHGVW